MFLNVISKLFRVQIHLIAQILKKSYHVSIIGSSGGVGSPLSMLLKQSPMITKLSLMDILPHTLGVSMDCSHIEGKARVKAYKGIKSLKPAVRGAEMIVLAAGGAGTRKTGQTRASQFQFNAAIIKTICDVTARFAPNAIILLITNPVNTLIPMICELYKKHKVYDPRKIIGMSTLDTVRANRFLSVLIKKNPLNVHVPVIGGHSIETIVPVFSQSVPKHNLNQCQIDNLTRRLQMAGAAVVKAKNIDGSGSATLAMSYAAARCIYGLCLAKNGANDVVESVFIRSDCHPDVKYLATPALFGPNGIEANLGIPKLNKHEQNLLDRAIKVLKEEIKMGVDFIAKKKYETKINDKKPPSKSKKRISQVSFRSHQRKKKDKKHDKDHKGGKKSK